MIIGRKFSRKYHPFLKEIGRLSRHETSRQIAVQKIYDNLEFDRTEFKNALEYLQELNFIKIETIGGPLLYGHITITKRGLQLYHKLTN